MDLRQLTALVTVAEVGSVTKAARLLNVVQPAITRQIRTLEKEIGVPLFDRTRHGMVPTSAARCWLSGPAVHCTIWNGLVRRSPDPGQVTGIVSVGLLESVIDILA